MHLARGEMLFNDEPIVLTTKPAKHGKFVRTHDFEGSNFGIEIISRVVIYQIEIIIYRPEINCL